MTSKKRKPSSAVRRRIVRLERELQPWRLRSRDLSRTRDWDRLRTTILPSGDALRSLCLRAQKGGTRQNKSGIQCAEWHLSGTCTAFTSVVASTIHHSNRKEEQ